MKRRTALQTLGQAVPAGLLMSPGPAPAQARTAVVYGYSAVSDFATVFVATDEGFLPAAGST